MALLRYAQPALIAGIGVMLAGAWSLPKLALVAGFVVVIVGGVLVANRHRIVPSHEAATCVLENMNYMESLSSEGDELNENEQEELMYGGWA